MWDVTEHSHQVWNYHGISTHTSRVGCDSICSSDICHPNNFYSHIPCGMWLYASKLRLRAITFLLTHPVWDVTCPLSSYSCICQFLLTHPVWDVTSISSPASPAPNISTHTSRVGCDKTSVNPSTCLIIFLLTHPVWDVTHYPSNLRNLLPISTHTSRVGCDFIL